MLVSTPAVAYVRRYPLALALVIYVLAATLSRGGLATSEHPGDVHHYSTFAGMVRDGEVPYRDFFMEYPPAALVPFLIPEAWPSRYLALFKILMFVCGGLLVFVVGRLGRSRRTALLAVAVSPLLIGPVFLTRYDSWPALLAATALLALLRDRWRIGGMSLAAAVAAKLFAVALLPLVAIHIWRRGGQGAFRQAAASFCATTIVLWGPFLALGPGGVRFSLTQQLSRGLQIESTGAAILLALDKVGLYSSHWVRGLSIDLGGETARAVGALTTAFEGVAILVVAWAYTRGRPTAERFRAAYAAVTVAFVAFGKVLSPQFLIWLIPLVPPIESAAATVILLVALLFTQLEVNYGDWGLRNVDWSVWLLAVRDALLLALFAVVLRLVRAGPRGASARPPRRSRLGSGSGRTCRRSPR